MRFRNIDVDDFVFFMLHLIFPTFLIVFRHQGNTRTFKHNLSVASLLSFVAGLVNVVGFLSVQRLTTNVTAAKAEFPPAQIVAGVAVAAVGAETVPNVTVTGVPVLLHVPLTHAP